jgi:hypothetical protein
MISVRKSLFLSTIACACAVAAPCAAASAADEFPAHIRQAFAAYDGAARLIVDGRYEDAAAALAGLSKALPEPYSAKATAAAALLDQTVIKPRVDARSSYLRSRRRLRAAEVCLVLHAYREAADIYEQVAADAAIVIHDDARIEFVRRAYRHAGSNSARFRDLFDRCRAVDPAIYSRLHLERDESTAARRRDGEPFAELTEDLPAELPELGFEEFHWLRLRRLCDAWPESPTDRLRLETVLGESIIAIGDWSNLRTATIPEHGAMLPTGPPAIPVTNNPFQTPAPVSPPKSAPTNDADREAVARITQMLEVDRVDAAVPLCRELIHTGVDPDIYLPAVLQTAAVLVESKRFDQAIQLYGRLILAPQCLLPHDKREVAIAAYHCCIRSGSTQQGLLWATMAVEQFNGGRGCGLFWEARKRSNDYLLAEARLRADPNDAQIDAGFDTMAKYGLFDGSIGGLIAAEFASRENLDALQRRIDRLEQLDADGKLPVPQSLTSMWRPISKEVIPGMRIQLRLQRALTTGRWEPLWENLLVGDRRVHEAMRLLDESTGDLEDMSARQTAALLLDRPKETLHNLGRVRNIDDQKLGWSLYLAATLNRPGIVDDLRARFDTLAADPDENLPANYLDYMTAVAALPKKERAELLGRIRSARFQFERKHADDPGFRPVPLERLSAVRRPRYLEE